jgi:hypothetical protein
MAGAFSAGRSGTVAEQGAALAGAGSVGARMLAARH